MRVTGDLGFSSLVLVVVVVAVLPLIGFVILRKWQLSEARGEDIKRLLILAAEETARAENEALYAYDTAVSAAPTNHCAVCYFPATARCSQCKSVHYWCVRLRSFKCQTVHWRQGHKLECRPPSTNHQSDDVTSDLGSKVVEQGYAGIHGKKPESETTECKTASEMPPISDASYSPKISSGKGENIRVESLAEENIKDSNSELSSSSFSGFSASTGSSDSSDDSSVCETIISNEHDRSEGCIFVNPAHDIADNTSCDNGMGVTMPASPKFASLVESVDVFSTMNKLNNTRPGFSEEKSKLASNGKPGSNMWKGKTTRPSTAFSGFWDKALDSRGINKNDTHPSYSDESTGKKTVSESSFHFSFSIMPPLHVRDTKTKDSVSVDAFPNCIGNNVSCPGSTLSKNDNINSSNGRDFSFINSKISKVTRYATLSGSEFDLLESKDSSAPPLSSFPTQSPSDDKDSVSLDALNIHNLQSTGSTVSNHVVDNCGSTLKSTEIRCLSRELADSNLALRTEEHSSSSTRRGNNGIKSETRAVTSSQVASCSTNSKSCLKTSVLKVVDQFRGSNLSKLFPLAVGSDITGTHDDKSKDTKSPVSPLGIISRLQNIGSQLGPGREEDAHEFLRHVIDTMQSICLMEAGVNAPGSLKQDTTLMGLTFGGYLRSKIKCMKCGGKSERQERMMDLTVEIEGEIATLVEALHRFTSTETLDGENKYHCVRCKSYERAKKKLTVSEAPNVLTVALKRFQSGKFGKLNKPIQFPEILNLAPFMSGTSDKSPIYRLYGVVVHLDVMNAAFSGHYVCYVKNIQNKWFKVDDSVILEFDNLGSANYPVIFSPQVRSSAVTVTGISGDCDWLSCLQQVPHFCLPSVALLLSPLQQAVTVTAVELERVLTKGAYMLFYARCSPRAPRLVRNRILSPDSKSSVSGKTLATKARYVSSNSGVAEHVSSSISPDGSAGLESFYSKFHHLKRILEEDSSSDNSSLISSNSDEGSCSTDSTRDSSSTDDLSDYIFGDSGNGWSSLWRNSDSDASSSSSSSPLNPRHSPLSDMERYDSVSPDVERRGIDISRLHSNTSLQHRKLDSGTISSNSSRETGSFLKVGSNHFNDINSGGDLFLSPPRNKGSKDCVALASTVNHHPHRKTTAGKNPKPITPVEIESEFGHHDASVARINNDNFGCYLASILAAQHRLHLFPVVLRS
ncbi:hypothetical protein Fmac_007964 [Flemingia macrophylla]|uniref:USP domain-containing protein n=1 Tax=Flemingia macrophylla TaxID=520843 RepID=A0ABD1MW28_9FABA